MKSAGKIIIFSRIHSNCFFFLLPSFYKTFSVCGQWLFESIDYYVTTIHHAYPFFLSSISRRDLFEKRSDLSCSLISIQCVPWIAPNLGTLGSDFSPFFVPHTKSVGWSSYLSVVDIVMRGKRRRSQIAGNDNRLARVEYVVTGLNEDIGSSYDVVLGSFASSVTSASSRRIVGEVHVARLRHKDTLQIKWRQSLVSRR